MRRLPAACASVLLGLMIATAPAHAAQNQNLQQTANPQIPQTDLQTKAPKTHTVSEGETLSSIAHDNQLDDWRPLWNANPQLTDPNVINVGDQLTIPDGPTTDRPLPSQAAPATSYPTPAYYSAPAANRSAPAGDVFARIRARESGGNYADNTGNGYYGAYQFDDGTWGGYGGYRHASDAPPAVQDAKAAETYARRGCSPWPSTCY